MIAQSDTQAQDGWLEIREGEGSSQTVLCPHRGMLNLPECLGCPRCDGLAMNPDGSRVYIVCTPSDADGETAEQL